MEALRQAAQQALNVLESHATHGPLPGRCPVRAAEYALRAALERQEQVACDTLAEYSGDGAQRKWVTVGAWLTPGERIVHLGPPPRD